MIYISAQPATVYYAWQVEVMLNNFISKGINPKDIDVLVACNTNDPRTSSEEHKLPWDKLVKHFSDVNFYFYQDLRLSKSYVSSIRPNVLSQFYKDYPKFSELPVFYHDCDILFTKQVDFSKFLDDEDDI